MGYPIISLFNLIDTVTNTKLYSFKLTQYNANTSSNLFSIYDDVTNAIFNYGAFGLEITYAFNNIIPAITYLQVYSNLALTNAANGTFYLRFTTADASLLDAQANRLDPIYTPTNDTLTSQGNYDQIKLNDNDPSNIVYTFGPATNPFGSLFINYYTTSALRYTAKARSHVVPISIPAINTSCSCEYIDPVRTRQAKMYYINTLLELGYTQNQIIPVSYYTDYVKVVVKFPSFDLRQLFMEGNQYVTNSCCYNEYGKIY